MAIISFSNQFYIYYLYIPKIINAKKQKSPRKFRNFRQLKVALRPLKSIKNFFCNFAVARIFLNVDSWEVALWPLKEINYLLCKEIWRQRIFNSWKCHFCFYRPETSMVYFIPDFRLSKVAFRPIEIVAPSSTTYRIRSYMLFNG